MKIVTRLSDLNTCLNEACMQGKHKPQATSQNTFTPQIPTSHKLSPGFPVPINTACDSKDQPWVWLRPRQLTMSPFCGTFFMTAIAAASLRPMKRQQVFASKSVLDRWLSAKRFCMVHTNKVGKFSLRGSQSSCLGLHNDIAKSTSELSKNLP